MSAVLIPSSAFEPNARATADHHDGLACQFGLTLDGRERSCNHDPSERWTPRQISASLPGSAFLHDCSA